jgi:hypothetical protein
MLRYRQMRKETYQEFLKRWDELEQTDFGEQLLETIKGKSKADKQ